MQGLGLGYCIGQIINKVESNRSYFILFLYQKKKKIEQANISYYYKQVFGFKYSN